MKTYNVKDGVSKILRQKRPRGLHGECRDTARCYVKVDGVRLTFSLGRWATQEAELAYRQVCANFYNGIIKPPVEQRPADEVVTVAELLAKYLETKIIKDRQSLEQAELLIQKVLDLYADLPVEQFSAMSFRCVRDCLIKYSRKPQRRVPTKSGEYYIDLEPWSRNYINKLMNHLKMIFSWGISYDLVPPDVLAKIRSVRALSRDEAPEWMEDTEPVGAVPDSVVVRTLPYMQPIIADMVKIQRAACMRPCELCNLKVEDLDCSDPEVWRLSFKSHLTH